MISIFTARFPLFTLRLAALSIACLSLVSLSPVRAQALIWEWNDPDPNDSFCFGWTSCTMIGDLDGDGAPDLAVGASGTKVNGTYAGAVFVFSGRTGAILKKWIGLPGSSMGAGIAPAGDLDDDGVPDVFTGLGFALSAWISGATGEIHFLAPKGGWLASPGDIDGDGYRDLVATSAGLGIDTRAYSGRTGQVLWICGVTGNMSLAGDLDGDGIDELIVGFSQVEGWDHAWVLSGRTGSVKYDFPGPQNFTSQFGDVHGGLGDLDGDGASDFYIGDLSPPGSAIYSGKTGQIFWGQASPGILRAGDIDGDGVHDLLAAGKVTSGRTHLPIYPLFAGGYGLPGLVGDLDGDDCPDFFSIYILPGRVKAYSGMPLGAHNAGGGLADANGVVPRIGISAVPTAGAALPVNLSRVPPGTDAWLVLGDGMDSDAFPGIELRIGIPPGSLLVTPSEVFPVTTTEVAPGVGSATVEISIPAIAAGSTFRAQWIVSNPSGAPAPVALSRALDLTPVP